MADINLPPIGSVHWGQPLSDAIVAVNEDVETRVQGLNGVTGIWQGTQAEYDAIDTPSESVVYIIKPEPEPEPEP